MHNFWDYLVNFARWNPKKFPVDLFRFFLSGKCTSPTFSINHLRNHKRKKRKREKVNISSSSLTSWLEGCCGWREGSEKGEKIDTARWFNRNTKLRSHSWHLPQQWGKVHRQSLHPTVKPQHGRFSALFSCWRLKTVGRWRSHCSLRGSGTSFPCVSVWRQQIV